MGYKQEQIETNWTTLNQYVGNIHKSFIRMRCADNNGQVAQSTNTNTHNIGKWAMANKTEEGNGEHLMNTCVKHDYICVSANKKQKTTVKRNSQRGISQYVIYKDEFASS